MPNFAVSQVHKSYLLIPHNTQNKDLTIIFHRSYFDLQCTKKITTLSPFQELPFNEDPKFLYIVVRIYRIGKSNMRTMAMMSVFCKTSSGKCCSCMMTIF